MNLFAEQLKRLRDSNQYSMQQLADLAGVSKSMISKIERGEVQPTLDIATRLAQAFGKSLSSMLESKAEGAVVKIPNKDQTVWEDPVTHSLRKVLSPPFPETRLEWLLVTTPGLVRLELSALRKGSEKYILMVEGKIIIEVGEEVLSLEAGDSGYFAAHYPHAFINTSKEKAVYYLIIKH